MSDWQTRQRPSPIVPADLNICWWQHVCLARRCPAFLWGPHHHTAHTRPIITKHNPSKPPRSVVLLLSSPHTSLKLTHTHKHLGSVWSLFITRLPNLSNPLSPPLVRGTACHILWKSGCSLGCNYPIYLVHVWVQYLWCLWWVVKPFSTKVPDVTRQTQTNFAPQRKLLKHLGVC